MNGVIIFIIVGIFICGCCAAISEQEHEEVNQDQDLEKRIVKMNKLKEKDTN